MGKLFNSSFRMLVLFLAISSSIFIAGCGDDDDDPVAPGGNNNQTNTITLDGAGFDNEIVNLAGGAAYVTSENATGVIMQGMADATPVVLIISFPGSSTGTYNWQLVEDNATSYAIVALTANQTDTSSVYVSTGTAGATQVSSYGSVGQNIAGTFSGNLININGTPMTVTGSFNVARGPDEE